MFKNLSHQILEHSRFRIPNKQYEPPKNLKRTLNCQLLANVIYYILSIVICWITHFDIISFITWFMSSIITALELNKRLVIGYNEIKKVEGNLKKKYGKLPQNRPRFFRQFYEMSLKLDFALLLIITAFYIAENLVNNIAYGMLRNSAMTITLILLLFQNIILNLYEHYKARDIY